MNASNMLQLNLRLQIVHYFQIKNC